MHGQRELGELGAFLVNAKAASYAADDPGRVRRMDDGGDEAAHEDGAFRYRDRWYGGARFTGEEVVWREGRPCWTMSFFGATEAAAPAEFAGGLSSACPRYPPPATLA